MAHINLYTYRRWWNGPCTLLPCYIHYCTSPSRQKPAMAAASSSADCAPAAAPSQALTSRLPPTTRSTPWCTMTQMPLEITTCLTSQTFPSSQNRRRRCETRFRLRFQKQLPNWWVLFEFVLGIPFWQNLWLLMDKTLEHFFCPHLMSIISKLSNAWLHRNQCWTYQFCIQWVLSHRGCNPNSFDCVTLLHVSITNTKKKPCPNFQKTHKIQSWLVMHQQDQQQPVLPPPTELQQADANHIASERFWMKKIETQHFLCHCGITMNCGTLASSSLELATRSQKDETSQKHIKKSYYHC